jgi:hypothetical protein
MKHRRKKLSTEEKNKTQKKKMKHRCQCRKASRSKGQREGLNIEDVLASHLFYELGLHISDVLRCN